MSGGDYSSRSVFMGSTRRGTICRQRASQQTDRSHQQRDRAEGREIARAHAVDHAGQHSAQCQSTRQTDHDTEQRRLHAFNDNHAQDIANLRPQRHADANLPHAPAHRIRQHAVDAHRSQQQRQPSKARQQQHREALLQEGFVDCVLHGPDKQQWHFAVDAIHCITDRRDNAAGIGVGACGKSHAERLPMAIPSGGSLPERHVEHRRRARLTQRVVFHVGYDTDDLACGPGEEVHREAFADRIFIGPELLGHGLADEHHARPAGDIGVGEVAPAQQWNVHRASIAPADQPDVDLGLVGHRQQRPSFDLHGLMRAAAGQRQSVDDAG